MHALLLNLFIVTLVGLVDWGMELLGNNVLLWYVNNVMPT